MSWKMRTVGALLVMTVMEAGAQAKEGEVTLLRCTPAMVMQGQEQRYIVVEVDVPKGEMRISDYVPSQVQRYTFNGMQGNDYLVTAYLPNSGDQMISIYRNSGRLDWQFGKRESYGVGVGSLKWTSQMWDCTSTKPVL